MNLSTFFIDRPRFAAVLSFLVFLIGLLALFRLPIAEYPEVTPPQVVVRAVFPGANPRVIAETVATPLEEQINGVENMLYMSSQSTADGSMQLTVTFDVDTEPNIDQVNVQNRMAQAQPNLPTEVNQFGLTMRKITGIPMMLVSLLSPNDSYDALFLANYANINIVDALYRVPGVGEVRK